jgi:hypothetical protein
MCNPENKTCPRCRHAFECRANDIAQCACYALQLGEQERVFIAHTYTGCLCVDCLKEIKAIYHQNNSESAG